LDPKTTRDLLDLLSQLNQQLGLTIVIITHQLETVKQICERVAVLSYGKLSKKNRSGDFYQTPTSYHPAFTPFGCRSVSAHFLEEKRLETDRIQME